MTLSETITRARKRADLSQAALASSLGIHVMTVSKWERGVYRPDPAILNQLAQALRISADELRRAWWAESEGRRV